MLRIIVSRDEQAAGQALRHSANLGLARDDEVMLVTDSALPRMRQDIGKHVITKVTPVRKRTKLSGGRGGRFCSYRRPPSKSGLVRLRFRPS